MGGVKDIESEWLGSAEARGRRMIILACAICTSICQGLDSRFATQYNLLLQQRSQDTVQTAIQTRKLDLLNMEKDGALPLNLEDAFELERNMLNSRQKRTWVVS